jgi:hypothetical protein
MRSFELSLLLLFLLLALLLDLVHLEVVLFLWHLFPLRYFDLALAIGVYFFLAYFLKVLPFFLLLFGHHISLRWLVVLHLCQVVDETGITCLLAYVYPPHFKLLAP